MDPSVVKMIYEIRAILIMQLLLWLSIVLVGLWIYGGKLLNDLKAAITSSSTETKFYCQSCRPPPRENLSIPLTSEQSNSRDFQSETDSLNSDGSLQSMPLPPTPPPLLVPSPTRPPTPEPKKQSKALTNQEENTTATPTEINMTPKIVISEPRDEVKTLVKVSLPPPPPPLPSKPTTFASALQEKKKTLRKVSVQKPAVLPKSWKVKTDATSENSTSGAPELLKPTSTQKKPPMTPSIPIPPPLPSYPVWLGKKESMVPKSSPVNKLSTISQADLKERIRTLKKVPVHLQAPRFVLGDAFVKQPSPPPWSEMEKRLRLEKHLNYDSSEGSYKEWDSDDDWDQETENTKKTVASSNSYSLSTSTKPESTATPTISTSPSIRNKLSNPMSEMENIFQSPPVILCC